MGSGGSAVGRQFGQRILQRLDEPHYDLVRGATLDCKQKEMMICLQSFEMRALMQAHQLILDACNGH